MKLLKAFLVITLTTTIFISFGIAAENTKLNLQDSNVKINSDTPATALSEFFYAFMKKDVARFKKRITNETLKIMTDAAKEKKIDIDVLLKQFLDSNPLNVKRRPVMQKQKLNGDKATIEAYLEGKWQVVPLVRQDDIWRVDFMAMG